MWKRWGPLPCAPVPRAPQRSTYRGVGAFCVVVVVVVVVCLVVCCVVVVVVLVVGVDVVALVNGSHPCKVW